MKTNELYTRVHKNGERLPVRITRNGQFCWDEGPDAGMIADLICMDKSQDEEPEMRIVCDFSPYRAYNEKIAKTDWYVPNTDHTGATWFTSGHYPQNGCLEGYITAALDDECENDCFEIVENPEAFREKMIALTPDLERLITYAVKHLSMEKAVLGQDLFGEYYGVLAKAAKEVFPQLSPKTKELLTNSCKNE